MALNCRAKEESYALFAKHNDLEAQIEEVTLLRIESLVTELRLDLGSFDPRAELLPPANISSQRDWSS